MFLRWDCVSPWWSVRWVRPRGSMSSASHWTAYERPAWRWLSPARQNKQRSQTKKESQEYLAAFVNVVILTTWLSVITRSRVSQHDLTTPRGNVAISSFRSPSTWSVVVSSLLPEGGQLKTGLSFLYNQKAGYASRHGETVSPPARSISLMQNLAVDTAAGWWAGELSVNRKSLPLRTAQTPCCAALRTWKTWKIKYFYSVVNWASDYFSHSEVCRADRP